jgi:hypothetical protein
MLERLTGTEKTKTQQLIVARHKISNVVQLGKVAEDYNSGKAQQK